MLKKMIMLLEDNPDDEALTLRALRQNNLTSRNLSTSSNSSKRCAN
jgi:hypothetical protein